MYKLLGYPKADDIQFQLPPRDRIVPAHHKARGPAKLSLDDAQRLQEKKTKVERRKKIYIQQPLGSISLNFILQN